jgi:hypothetical protein
MKQQPEQVTKRGVPQSILLTLMALLIVVASGVFYIYLQKPKAVASETVPVLSTDQVIDKVYSLADPKPEGKPAVALIKDIDEVRKGNPEFYKDAQNGDYFVLYSAKAFVYRPGENKIINSAVVTK